jgi:hypothetical protein
VLADMSVMLSDVQTVETLIWPQIAMDEAGNSGENLLDRSQPVHALVGVNVDLATAEPAISAALNRTQMGELKFAQLRRSGRGRRNILALLDHLKLVENQAAAYVTDKEWMLAAKLVDELVEPRMLAAGTQMDWYLSGNARAMAEVLYERGRPVLRGVYDDLAAAFVPMVRDYDRERGQAFLTALRRARLAAHATDVHAVLAAMIDTESELAAEFETRSDALDPHLPALWWQAGHWSQRFDQFEILHDESNTAAGWTDALAMAARHSSAREASRTVAFGHLRIDLPAGVRDIRFRRSDADARIQVADILAGATAHVFGAVAQIHPEDRFCRELEQRGIGRIVRETIGRSLPTVRARRLGRSTR